MLAPEVGKEEGVSWGELLLLLASRDKGRQGKAWYAAIDI